MGTYRDMQDRIALEYLNRTDLLVEIKHAILNSIKATEPERFWFNETAVAAVAVSAVAVPSNFLVLDRLEITIASADYQLMQRSFDEIRDMNASRITGQPTSFAYHANAFQLALYPDSAYAMICYYIKSLPVLSADSDTNVWTTELANYIAEAATLDLLTNVVGAPADQISRHATALQVARNELNLRNTGRMTFRLRATSF